MRQKTVESRLISNDLRAANQQIYIQERKDVSDIKEMVINLSALKRIKIQSSHEHSTVDTVPWWFTIVKVKHRLVDWSYQSLDCLWLREWDANDRTIKGGSILADKGFSCLLLILEQNKGLLLAISLKNFVANNSTVLLQVTHYLFLGDILGNWGQVNHFSRRTAVAVILGCIAVESVKVRVEIFMGVGSWCDLRVSGKVNI